MDNSIYTYWSAALGLLKPPVLTEVTYNTIISRLVPISFENNIFVLKTHESFYKETIMQRNLHLLKSSLKTIIGQDVEVDIISQEDLEKMENINSKFPDKFTAQELASKSNIQAKYIFDTFVRGKSNDMAYAASVAVAQKPGQTYNPLFLYGGVGLGKTHLMHSIGNYTLQEDPNKKVLYCSSETFMNEMINSIKEHKNREFRNKYREIDVLLIDDIQFLSDKEGTQEEFFHTFNDLYYEQKQIVISSDKPPKDIKIIEERLRSRFSWGLTVDITQPDFETRTAILEKKAELDNIEVPQEVLMFISKNIVSNIRDLEGALNKVTAYSKLKNSEVTIEIAQIALKDLIGGEAKKEINVPFIQEIVANYYSLTPEELRSKTRTQEISNARQIAMYLSKKFLDIPLSKIGMAFNGRNHSTIIHGCDKIESDLKTDLKLKAELTELENKIRQ